MFVILQVLFLSAVPLIEQRGAIPLGLIHGIHPLIVFVVSLVGSMLPVPLILLFFTRVYDFLGKRPKFAKIIKLIDKKIAVNENKFDKYKELALITFIAIPLPTTGLWTGSLIAAFLKFDFKKSMACAFIGGAISAALITSILVFAPRLFGA